MSFWDSLKEMFGGAGEAVQNVQEQVNLEDLQQKAEDLGQGASDAAGQVGEEVAKKVEELKSNLPGQQ